jgi:hypothetical protein
MRNFIEVNLQKCIAFEEQPLNDKPWGISQDQKHKLGVKISAKHAIINTWQVNHRYDHDKHEKVKYPLKIGFLDPGVCSKKI